MRLLTILTIAAAIVSACLTGPAEAGNRFASGSVTWQDIHVAFEWPVLRPTENAGLHLKRLDIFSATCDADTDYEAYTALYGSPRARSFSLYIGRKYLCGDGPESATVAHVRIRGHRVVVDVPLFNTTSGVASPTVADGYTHGMSLYWKQGSTAIDIEATHLHLSELVQIAKSLEPIAG